MSLTVFNIGKAEIRNIFVTITGDNITSDQGEVYLGNIGEGSDTYFDGNSPPLHWENRRGRFISSTRTVPARNLK